MSDCLVTLCLSAGAAQLKDPKLRSKTPNAFKDSRREEAEHKSTRAQVWVTATLSHRDLTVVGADNVRSVTSQVEAPHTGHAAARQHSGNDAHVESAFCAHLQCLLQG